MPRLLPLILLSCVVALVAVFGGVSARISPRQIARTESMPAASTVVSAASEPAPAAPAPAIQDVERRGGVACATPHVIVDVSRDLQVRSRPDGPVVGTVPARSVYLGQPMRAWVQAVSTDGSWGRITIPWVKPVTAAGWIPVAGLSSAPTRLLVVADLSERLLRVFRGCAEVERAQIAIGRPGSPSPVGRFWVTDRIEVPAQQQGSFGSYAFGLSAVQPRLPAGWSGGNQMAIHGTGSPGSIGQAASAGCLRVSQATLDRLRPLLQTGTPVVIVA